MPSVLKAATLWISAILRLPATWWQRAHFRAQLRADIADAGEFLHDIGINLHEAQAEAAQFFWEPVTLTRRHLTSPEAAPRLAVDLDFRSDTRVRWADIAKAASLKSKPDFEVG
jgi:uncharacterized protein YjiS (DUF1127 family)